MYAAYREDHEVRARCVNMLCTINTSQILWVFDGKCLNFDTLREWCDQMNRHYVTLSRIKQASK